MPRSHRERYQHQALQQLASTEWMLAADALRSCAGAHALQISAFGADPPPRLPLIAHWVGLHLASTGYAGDLRLDAELPLPFADDSFHVLWLKHALDCSPQSSALLADSIRVLAPGGTLLISGVHPLGVWAPWWALTQREAGQYLQAPWLLRHALRLSGLTVHAQWRQGAWLPRGGPIQPRRTRLGGSYMLLARKHRAEILPFISRLATRRQLADGRMGAAQAASPWPSAGIAAAGCAAETCKLQASDRNGQAC